MAKNLVFFARKEDKYRISANSFRGNYSFLKVGVRQLFKGGNYSREETINLLLFVSIDDFNNCRTYIFCSFHNSFQFVIKHRTDWHSPNMPCHFDHGGQLKHLYRN